MLKKFNVLALIVLLVFQTMIAPIAATAQGTNTTEAPVLKDGVLVDDQEEAEEIEGELSSTRTVAFEWTLNENIEIGEIYSSNIPENSTVEQEQTGKLTYEEEAVGLFSVTEDGVAVIEFDEGIEGLPEAATGTFEIEVEVVTEEEIVEEPEATDGGESNTEEENDEAIEDITKEVADEEVVDKQEETTEKIDKKEDQAVDEESTDELKEVGKDKDSTTELKETSDKVSTKTVQKKDNILARSSINMAATGDIEENIITGIQLRNEFGELIALFPDEGEETVRPTIDDSIGIYFDWEIPNGHTYKPGDTFKFQLPEVFKLYNGGNGSLDQYGEFVFDADGKVTFTFNDNITTGSNISGTFEIRTEFDKEQMEDATNQKITFPLGNEEKSVDIHFQVSNAEDISKDGVPNKAKNPTGAIWTVDFNKSEEMITEPLFTDPITGDHAYKTESAKVYELDVKLNGDVEQGEEISENEYEIIGDLEIKFGDSIDRAYRVIYETSLTEGSRPELLENNVWVTGTDGTDLSTDATVNLPYGALIEKEVGNYNSENQTAKWAVKYNYGEQVIPADKAKFTDTFEVKTSSEDDAEIDSDNAHAYDEKTFDVYPITFDEAGNEVKGEALSEGEYDLVFNGNSFELDFKGEVTSAYKIEYETIATENVYDDHYVENIVETDGVTVSQGQGFQQVVLNKGFTNINYAAKEIEWKIELNKNLFPMEDITITDTYAGQGVTLLEDSVQVNGSKDGVIVNPDPSYDEGFKIEFNGNAAEQAHIITYTTKFDPTTHNGSITNHAQALWIEGNETKDPKTDVIEVPIDDYTKNNGGKSGTYNAVSKKVSWQVDINYNLHDIATPIVKDTYSPGQELDLESFRVQELLLTGEGNGVELVGAPLVEGEDYTVTKSGDGFELVFTDSIDKSYRITYETSVANQQVTKDYTNEATLHDDNNEISSDLATSVEVKQGGEYIGKEGAQVSGEKVIDWQLYVNRSQSDIDAELKVTDEPGLAQVLIQDSIKVYGTTVAADGTVTIDETVELVKGTDYHLATEELADGSDKFTVEFTNAFSVPYAITYRTFINTDASEGATITNNVSLEGSEIVGDAAGTETGIAVRTSSGSGSATSETGTLTIEKVDAEDHDTKLDGAVFELWDSGNLVKIKEGTTGADGKVEFRNLLHGDYILKETGAPEGYVVGINNAGQRVVHIGQTEMIENKKIKRHVQLNKMDSVDGTDLEGAEFELFNENDPNTPVEVNGETVFETNADGQIFLDDLDAGSYFFKEKVAPEDYQLDETHHGFTIEEEQTEIDVLNLTNILKLGSAVVKKVDLDNLGNGLEGAEFSVTNAGGTIVKSGLTSDEDGVVNIGDLAPGIYTLTETEAPRGYHISDTAAEGIAFEIKRESAGESEHNITLDDITNEVKTTNIKLIKTDSVTGETLAGATFDLYDSEGTELERGTTNSSGELTFEADLKPGDYQVQEITAPVGYISKSDPVDVEITIDHVHGNGTVSTIVTETIENDPLAHISLTKVDAESQVPLEGAIFGVVAKIDDDYVYDVTEDDDFVEGFANLSTDINGNLDITGLPAGSYKVVERVAPNGYTNPNYESREIIIAGNETVTTDEPLGDIENEIIRGSVQFVKKDAKTGEILPGVEFTLESTALKNDQDEAYFNDDIVTDEDGKVSIGGLRPGEYEFIETTPYAGYQAHVGEITFEIALDSAEELILPDVLNHKLVDIEVTKEWEDNWIDNDNNAERPDEITVVLLQNGESIDDYTMKATENWKHTFVGLNAVNPENGDEYTYTIEEQTEEGYISEITGNAEDGFVITNTAKTTSLELTKQDFISDKNLTGAEFTLTHPDGTLTQYGVTEDGKLTFGNLQPGKYILIETEAPVGYIADPTPIPIEVTLADVESSMLVTEDITNDPYAEVKFTKVDAETEVPLTGAVFKVTDMDDVDMTDFTNLSVDADGELSITGLPAGDYKLVETTPPIGYVLSDNEVEFTVSEGLATETIELENFNNEIIRGSVEFIKTDADGNPMEEVEFRLESIELVNETEQYLGTHFTDQNGKMFVENLRPGTYIFTEKFPDGYQEYVGKDLTFTIDPVDGETDVDLEEVINHELVDLVVTKEWKDDENATGTRPNDDGIEIELSKEIENGSKEFVESVTLTEDDAIDDSNWEYTFEDLDAVDSTGNSYTYTVEELDVEGYTSNVEPAVDGYKITNLRTDTVEVAGEKTWNETEDGDQYRPDSIRVHLLANGDPTNQSKVVTVDANDTWKYEFTDLDQFDEEGKEIEYTIEEENILGYTWEVDDEYNLTNTQETINISGKKTWKDNGESRPESITIQVLNSTGIAQEEDFSTENDSFEFTFKDLPKYDKEGNEIEYTINELPVPGYTTEIVGTDITNTRSDIVDVKGTKSWKDDEAEDRPTEITVQLLTNGEAKDEDTVEVTEATNWEYEFTDLVAYDENGLAIVYTVIDDVEGYKANVNGYNITNVRTGTTEVNGEKIWLDELDEHSAITVELLADGTKVDETEVNAASDWKYEFTDLDKYDEEGKEITYTVDEVKIDGYETIIDNFTITNLRVGTTELLGEKIWLDDDSDERPGSITVQLLANGSVVDTDEVTADSGWTYEFTNLDQYDDQGIEIKYTVDEEEVPEGYEKSFDGNNLTNLRVGTTEVSGEKTWLEVDEQYRPDLITVNLLADGKEVESQDVTIDVEDEWKFTFTDLDKYDAKGKEIDYTIVEVEVPGYVSEVDGYDITNTQETTEITGTKTWKDDDAEDRPMSITVQLMNADVVVQEQEVTAEDNWNFMFADLAKYDIEGNEIDYMINELPVPGYATTIEGYDIINTMADQIDVAGTKTWKGDDAEDRPVSITVQLLANGEVVDSVEVTAETDWTYIFENIEAYDAEGIAIVYAVAEIDVDGYETSINGYDITNTLIPIEEDSAVAGEDPADKDRGNVSVNATDEAGKTVPATATNIYNLALIGFGLMLLGLIIFLVRRKRIE